MIELENVTTLAVKMDDIKASRAKLEEFHGVKMSGHDSEYWGIYYKTPFSDRSAGEITVKNNAMFEESGPSWGEEEFKEFPLLIVIVDIPTLAGLETLIEAILSDLELSAVVVDKDFFDDEGNEVDLQGNIIKKAADFSGP